VLSSWRSRATVLTAVATMAVPVLGLAGPAGASANAVPFKASVSGTWTSPEEGLFIFAGTGNASHLGNITDNATQNLPISSIETLTAANGDTLTLSDTQCLISSLSISVAEITCVWSVTGGTGRFSGATGSGTLDMILVFSPNPSSFTETWTGSIAY